MRSLSILLVGLLGLPCPPAMLAQEPAAPHKLNLVIIEGDGAINNIRQRTAREPIVQVEDENHKPVAGAAVVFLLPEHGAGGTFADGSHSFSVTTNAQGRAAARGIHLNNTPGQFTIQVTASINGLTATVAIGQSIAAGTAGAAGGAAAGAAISTKLIVILAVVAGAAAGGVVAATHSGGSSNAATATGTSITAGAGTVGPPH